MELSTHTKGAITELAVQQAFLSHGFGVSVPILPTSRYDMIADIDGHLFKVQIKTARPVKDSDAFRFSLKSSRTHRWGVTEVKYDKSEVDMFATWYNGNVYVVPQYLVEGRAECILRNSSANDQTKGIHFAEDFELNNVINRWKTENPQLPFYQNHIQ